MGVKRRAKRPDRPALAPVTVHTEITHPVRFLATVTNLDVKEAAEAMRSFSADSQHVAELATAAGEGRDLRGNLGDMQNYIARYRKVSSVHKKLLNILGTGRPNDQTMDLAEKLGFFDADSPLAMDPFLHNWEESTDSIRLAVKGIQERDRSIKQSPNARLAEPVSEATLTGANVAMDRLENLSKTLGDLAKATDNFTNVQKEHLSTIEGLHKAYTDVTKVEEDLAKRAKFSQRSDAEQGLLKRIQDWEANSGADVNQLVRLHSDIRYGEISAEKKQAELSATRLGKSMGGFDALRMLNEPLTVTEKAADGSVTEVTKPGLQAAIDRWNATGDRQALGTLQKAHKAFLAAEGGNISLSKLDPDMPRLATQISQIVSAADVFAISAIKPVDETESGKVGARATYLAKYTDENVIKDVLDRSLRGDNNAFHHLQRIVQASNTLLDTAPEDIPKSLARFLPGIRYHVAEEEDAGRKGISDYKLNEKGEMPSDLAIGKAVGGYWHLQQLAQKQMVSPARTEYEQEVVTDGEGMWQVKRMPQPIPAVYKTNLELALDAWEEKRDPRALYTIKRAQKAMQALEGGKGGVKGVDTIFGDQSPELMQKIGLAVHQADLAGIQERAPLTEREAAEFAGHSSYLQRYQDPAAVTAVMERFAKGDATAFFHLKQIVSSADALAKTGTENAIPDALKTEMFNIRANVVAASASGMEAHSDYKAAEQQQKRIEAFRFDPQQIKDMTIHLEAFSKSLKDIQQVTQGATEENRNYLKIAQNQIKTFDEMSKQLEFLNKKAEAFNAATSEEEKKALALTPEESNLQAKLKAAIIPQSADQIGKLRDIVTGKHANALFAAMSDDEHQQYMIEALFTGGKRGRDLRGKLTDVDYERGVDLPFIGETSDKGQIQAFGTAGRLFQSAMSPMNMFMLRHGAQMIQQEFGRAEKYDEARYTEGAMLARSGYIDAASFTDSNTVYGNFMARRAARINMDRAMGKAASDALSPLLDAQSGIANLASGLAPALVAGSLGLGAGMLGAGIGAAGTAAGLLGAGAAFTIGAPLALGATALSLIGTASANANDWYTQAKSSQQFDLGGVLGQFGNGIGGVLSGNLKYRTKSAVSGTVLQMIQSGMTADEIRGSGFDSLSWGQTTRYNVGNLYTSQDIKGMQFQNWRDKATGAGLEESVVNEIFGAMSFMDPNLNATGVVNERLSTQAIQLAKMGISPSSLASGTLVAATAQNIGIGNTQGLSNAGMLYASLLSNTYVPPNLGITLPENAQLRQYQVDAALNLMGQKNPERDVFGLSQITLADAFAREQSPSAAYAGNLKDEWQKLYIAQPGASASSPLYKAMSTASTIEDGKWMSRLMGQLDMGSFAARYGILAGTNDLPTDRSTFDTLTTTISQSNNLSYAALGESLTSPLATLLSQSSNPGQYLNDPKSLDKVISSTAQLIARNVDPNNLVSIRMARTNQADTQANRTTFSGALLAQELIGDLDPGAADREKALASFELSFTGAGWLTGRNLTLTDNQRQYFEKNVAAQGIYSSIQNAASSSAIAGDGFYSANTGRYGSIANLTFTDPAAAARQNQQMGQSSALYQSRLGTLVTPNAAADFLGQAATQLAPKEYSQVVAALNGNQVAWSQLAASGVLGSEFATVDLETGADAYRYGINSTEYGNIQKYAARHGLTDMLGSPEMLAGGTRQMEMNIRDKSVEMARMQFATQMAGIKIERMFTNGGVSTLDAQGFSTAGRVASAVQGYQINPGNGMTGWQIEDAMTRIGREKQAYSMTMQGQSLNIQQGQFDLAGKQFYEKFALSQQQFAYNTGYQRTEMGIQRSQSLRQREWQAQDLAFQRDQSDVSFGWEQEDFDRNIRYARGRERLDLIRQKNRSVISHSMQMGQMDRQEDRFKEGSKWEDERFEREKKHFEKGIEFQRDEMAMQKRHFEEGRAFDKQRMDMQKDNYEKEIQWVKQTIELEDQKRLLDRQHYTIQQDMQVKLSGAMFAAQEQIRKWQESIQLTNEAMAAWIAKGGLAIQALDGMTLRFNTWLGILQNMADVSTTLPNNQPSGNVGFGTGTFNADGGYMDADYMRYWRGQQPRTFSDGGYTGIGGKYEPAGIVHRGEYVVPQQGAAVVRGDNSQTVELLKKVVQVLERIEGQGPGRVNATIYTNQSQVKTADLTAKDKAYARLKQ